MTHHDAQENQVWKVPGEFYNYFRTHPPVLLDDYPFLIDLLHMEWMEILVYNREERKLPTFEKQIPDLNEAVAVNPDHDVIELDFPVFKGDWESINDQKGEFKLLIFRDIDQFKVHFLEVSPLHLTLIDALTSGLDIKESINASLAQFGLQEHNGASEALLSFVSKLYDQGFLLGRLNQ